LHATGRFDSAPGINSIGFDFNSSDAEQFHYHVICLMYCFVNRQRWSFCSYKILELNCLAAIAAAILDGLAFIRVPLLELMVALVLPQLAFG
jgi:hypothetical protein